MVVYTKILKIKRYQRNISSHNCKTWPRVWTWALWTTPHGHVLSFISDLINMLGLGGFSNPAPGLVKTTDNNFWAPCLQKIQSHVSLGSKERDLTYGHLWDKFYVLYFIYIILLCPQNIPPRQDLLYPHYRFKVHRASEWQSWPSIWACLTQKAHTLPKKTPKHVNSKMVLSVFHL